MEQVHPKVHERLNTCIQENLFFLDLDTCGVTNENLTMFALQTPWLKEIYLDNNNISDISVLEKLPNLTQLSLSYNNISDISSFHFIKTSLLLNSLSIYKNPIKDILPEVLGTFDYDNVYYTIKDYLNTNRKLLYESKLLLVGNGDVGKSSLAKKIINNEYVAKKGSLSSTEGIDVTIWTYTDSIQGQKRDVRINIWDFSGQEIDWAVHQFFMTKSCLYLFVFDSRKNDEANNFVYWLNIIRKLSPDSPVLVVMNQFDNQKQTLNEEKWISSFPQIKKFITVNCSIANDTGVEKLKDDIKHFVKDLPYFGTEWAIKWDEIRTELEKQSITKKIHRLERIRTIVYDQRYSRESRTR
jgi:internalin A